MKLRITIIAALIALVALAAPAWAAEQTLYADPMKLTDDKGIVIEIDHVKVSDMPTGYSTFNYPPTEYKFYTLYYTLSNPTDERLRYQFLIHFVDDKGRSYTSEEFNLADWLNANSRTSLQPKEFAVYRNATGVHLEWTHINQYWRNETVTNITLVEAGTETAAATPTAEATPQPTATPTPTPTPTPTSASKPCLPFLPMVVLAGGAGAAGVFVKRLTGRR